MELNDVLLEFNSIGECSDYLKNNYTLSCGTVKTLLKTEKTFNSNYKRLKPLNSLILKYID